MPGAACLTVAGVTVVLLGLTATLAAAVLRRLSTPVARRIAMVTAALVLFLMLPGSQMIAWGFYRYQEGPLAPPLSLTTFLFLYAVLAAALLNVAALRLLRREAPPVSEPARPR